MKLTLISNDGTLVKLAGEGTMTSQDFRGGNANPLEAAVGAKWQPAKVLLDMNKITYVDSSAIGWLLTCQKQMKKEGGRLILHSVPPNVMQILEMLKLGPILSVVKDEPAASSLAIGAPK